MSFAWGNFEKKKKIWLMLGNLSFKVCRAWFPAFDGWKKFSDMNAFQQMFPWRQIKLLKAFYTRQPFYIYRRDIFYLKSAKIFRKGPIIPEDVRRRSEDFRRCYEEFRLTRTQQHKGTLTSPLIKENSEKVDHPHRLFFSLFGSGLSKYFIKMCQLML